MLFRSADDFTKRIAGGTSYKSISIKGGVWRMMEGANEIARNEDRAMNFVIVNAAENVSRTFYAGTYQEGVESSPSCFSPDGKTPDKAIKNPQSSSCQTCPQNIKGSGQGDARACRFSQRFAVVLEGDIGGAVYRLQLPAKSLFGKPEGDKLALQAYAKFLAGHGVPMSCVVTEARFDTNEAVPVLKFRAIRPLTREEVAASRTQGQSDEAKAAIDYKLVVKEKADAAPEAFQEQFESPPAIAAPKAEAPKAEAAVTQPTKRESKKQDAPEIGRAHV